MNINNLLKKENLTEEEAAQVAVALRTRLLIEFKRQDRSGIYGFIQRSMGYNSNRIEGSTLTPAQTASLFDTGTICASKDTEFRAKDVEEMTGHFVMFNKLLQTIDLPLSESVIKAFHAALKSGVFEDIANGYPIGEYKNRANYVSDIQTVRPDKVPEEIRKLLAVYNPERKHTLEEIAKFHAAYESIHPFQDGNGRTGRAIVFRECLRSGMIPVIIKDEKKTDYYHALHAAQTEADDSKLVRLFMEDQADLYHTIQDMLYEYQPENAFVEPRSEDAEE